MLQSRVDLFIDVAAKVEIIKLNREGLLSHKVLHFHVLDNYCSSYQQIKTILVFKMCFTVDNSQSYKKKKRHPNSCVYYKFSNKCMLLPLSTSCPKTMGFKLAAISVRRSERGISEKFKKLPQISFPLNPDTKILKRTVALIE